MKKMIIKMFAKTLWTVGVTLHKITGFVRSNSLCRLKSNVIGLVIKLDVGHELNMFPE